MGNVGRDNPLKVQLEGSELVVRIGIDTLAFCAEHSPFVEQTYIWDEENAQYDESRFRVIDQKTFALEILQILKREEEDGSTPITKLFDQATEDAIGDGCQGVCILGEE